MTSAKHEFLLPRVEESDLLKLAYEDITDPGHQERWVTFTRTNKRLAREVLKRVYIAARAQPEHALEMQKIITDEITYVYEALTMAALRLSEEGQPSTVVDGADDEDQPPST